MKYKTSPTGKTPAGHLYIQMKQRPTLSAGRRKFFSLAGEKKFFSMCHLFEVTLFFDFSSPPCGHPRGARATNSKA